MCIISCSDDSKFSGPLITSCYNQKNISHPFHAKHLEPIILCQTSGKLIRRSRCSLPVQSEDSNHTTSCPSGNHCPNPTPTTKKITTNLLVLFYETFCEPTWEAHLISPSKILLYKQYSLSHPFGDCVCRVCVCVCVYVHQSWHISKFWVKICPPSARWLTMTDWLNE
jgi:hypothetical protein